MASRPKPSRTKARATAPRRPAAKPARRPARKPAPRTARPAKPAARPPAKGAKATGSSAPATTVVPEVPRISGRQHLLSLSFLRDGDEFLARIESDSGQITELKNRALDQLLTLVAGELEDLLE